MRSNFSTYIGLQRLFIMIMLILGRGARWVFLSRSCRIAIRFRCRHGRFPILVPSHWTGRVGPAILGFKMAYCAVKSDPISVRSMGFVSFGMNSVYHDVNMKVLLVFVSDENVLVFLEAKLVQRVQGAINPLCARRTFSRRPCQFIVENRVVAAR